MSSAPPPPHAFVPHLWKAGACRECTRSLAEHTGGAAATTGPPATAASAAPTPAARSPAKPFTATAAAAASVTPASPPSLRPVGTPAAAAATSPAAGSSAAVAPAGRVAALAKRAELIQPSAPALSAPPGVALKTQPASASAVTGAKPSPASSLPSTVGTAMTVAAAATAFRRPLVAKLPPPLPSVIAAGSNNTAAAAPSSQPPVAVKHTPPPPLPTAVLSVPDRPVPSLPPSSPAAAAARATSPIPDRPVPPLPASSAAARASPTSPTSPAGAGSQSPTNAASLAGMPPPPTRKPPAPPNRAPPKAPTTPVAAAVALPAAPVEPPSPLPVSAEPPPATRFVRAGSVGSSGPPRLPPPLSSVAPSTTATAAAASTPVPPIPSSALAPAAAPGPARVPPPLHAVVAAGAGVGPPPLPVTAASAAPPPAPAASTQRFPPPPPPQPQSQPPPILAAISEASSSVASPPPPPPPRGPPPLNPPASAAASAGPPPLPASAAKPASSLAPPALLLDSGTTATRLVDYFCVFGRGALCLDRSLDAPDFPSASRVYPDAQAASAAAWAALRFQPVLLPQQRYPAGDHRDSALSGNTASFAFPSYISLQLAAQREVDDPYAPSWVARRPRMHRFTLTKLDGTKQFCSSLTFYERLAGPQIDGLLAEIEAALRGRILKPSGSSAGAAAKDIDIEAFMIELRNGACGRTIAAPALPPALPPAVGRPPPPLPSSAAAAPRVLPPACALFAPKSLTVVSSWPFFSLWEAFLKALFRTAHVGLSQASIRKFAVARGDATGAGTGAGSMLESHPERYSVLALPLPLERMLVNFLCEIPVPPPGVLQVRFHLPPGSWLTTNGDGSGSASGGSDDALLISRPPINQLPLCDINWHLLFRAVAPESFVAIFTAVATEQKVLLVSRHANLITAVCDAVSVLLFPLAWQGVFMPLLPEPMLEFLYAPVPFLAGIDAACFAAHFDSATGDIDLPDELVLVELDALPSARIRIPADADSIPQLPEKLYSKLLAQLREHAGIHNPSHPFVRISDQAFPFGQEQDRIEMTPAAAAAMAARAVEKQRSAAVDTQPLPAGSPPPLVPAAYQALSTAFEPVQTYIPIAQQSQRRGSYPPPSRGASGSVIGGGAALSPSSVASLDSPPASAAGPSLDALSGTSASLDRGVELNVEQVREAFLRLWCKLLKSYEKFMPWGVHAAAAAAATNQASTPSSNGVSPPVSPTLSPAASPGGANEAWFNTAGFLSHAPRDARPFLTQLCRSQLFAKFVDDRILVRGDIEAWQASPAHPAFEQTAAGSKAGRKRAAATGAAVPPPLRSLSPSGFSTTSVYSATTPSHMAAMTPSHRSRASNLSSGGGGHHADDSDTSDHEGEGRHRIHPNDEDEPDEYSTMAAGDPSQSPSSRFHHSKNARSVSSMGFASRSYNGGGSGFHSRQSSTLDSSCDDCPPSTVCPPSMLSAQLDARDATLMPILAQVQFFDECIRAQKNRRRSKGVRGVLHNAGDLLPTPFLHDASHSVAQIEDTLRPSLEGLPAQPSEFGFPLLRATAVSLPSKSAPLGLQAATAVYPVFPTLDPSLFGQPRPIPMLSTERAAKEAAAAAEDAAAMEAAADEIAPELRFHFALPPPLPASASNGATKDDAGRAVRFAVDDSPPSSPRLSAGASHPAYSRATPANLRTTQRGSFIAFRARAPSGMQSHIAELANLLSFESFAAGAGGNGPPPVPSVAAAVSPPSSSSSSSAPVAIGNKTLHKLMEKERLKQEKARKKAEAAQRKDEAQAQAQAQQQQQAQKKKHVTWTPPVYSSSQSVQSAAAAAAKAATPDVTNPSALVRAGTVGVVMGRGRAGSSIFSFNDSGRIEPVNGLHHAPASSTSGKSVTFASSADSASSGLSSTAAAAAAASTPKSHPISSTKGAPAPPGKSKIGSTVQQQQGQQISAPIMMPVEAMPSVMQAQAQAAAQKGGTQPQQTPPPLPAAGPAIAPPMLPPPLPAAAGAGAAVATRTMNGGGPPPVPPAASASVSPPRLPPPLNAPAASSASASVPPPPLPSSSSSAESPPSSAAASEPASTRPPPPPRRMSTIAPPPLPTAAAAHASATTGTVQPRKQPPPLR